jgi:hypothetical protein
MIITIDLTYIISLLPYLLIGLGLGIASYYIFYDKNSLTETERKRHDLEVKKEWFRMLAEQKKELEKKRKWESRLGRSRY